MLLASGSILSMEPQKRGRGEDKDESEQARQKKLDRSRLLSRALLYEH